VLNFLIKLYSFVEGIGCKNIFCLLVQCTQAMPLHSVTAAKVKQLSGNLYANRANLSRSPQLTDCLTSNETK